MAIEDKLPIKRKPQELQEKSKEKFKPTFEGRMVRILDSHKLIPFHFHPLSEVIQKIRTMFEKEFDLAGRNYANHLFSLSSDEAEKSGFAGDKTYLFLGSVDDDTKDAKIPGLTWHKRNRRFEYFELPVTDVLLKKHNIVVYEK